MNRLVMFVILRGCKVANASPLAVLHGRKVKNPSPLDVLRGSEVANPSPSDVLHVCKVTNPRALATLRRSIAPPRGLSPFARLQNASEGSPPLVHGCKMPPRGLSPFCTGLFLWKGGRSISPWRKRRPPCYCTSQRVRPLVSTVCHLPILFDPTATTRPIYQYIAVTDRDIRGQCIVP